MRGLLRCSFYWIGQCESLDMRDEQRVQLPRFLYLCLNLNNIPPMYGQPWVIKKIFWPCQRHIYPFGQQYRPLVAKHCIPRFQAPRDYRNFAGRDFNTTIINNYVRSCARHGYSAYHYEKDNSSYGGNLLIHS